MLDNVEKIESECRNPDCRDWYADLEALAEEKTAEEAQLNAAMRAISDIKHTVDTALQTLCTLSAQCGHMPKVQELLDECHAFVECQQ
jgi:hypothetical protein